jgi:hypothetical protein
MATVSVKVEDAGVIQIPRAAAASTLIASAVARLLELKRASTGRDHYLVKAARLQSRMMFLKPERALGYYINRNGSTAMVVGNALKVGYQQKRPKAQKLTARFHRSSKGKKTSYILLPSSKPQWTCRRDSRG